YEKIKHTEYYEYGKYFVESVLTWDDSCGYVATLNRTNVPDFPAKKGSEMIVRFIETEDNAVIYSATVSNRTWRGKIYKIESIPDYIINYVEPYNERENSSE